MVTINRTFSILTLILIGLVIAAGSVTCAYFVIRLRIPQAPASSLLILPDKTDISSLNNYDAAMNGRVTTRTYSEPGVRQMVATLAGISQPVGTETAALVIPHEKAESELIQDPNRITAVLSAVQKQERYRTFPAIPLAILVGVVLGSVFRPSNLFLMLLGSTALFAALWKAIHACPICPVQSVLGVPIEYWGIASYGAVLAGLVAKPASRLLLVGIGALSAVIGVSQLYLFWSQTALCVPCTIIAVCNGALAAGAAHRYQVPTLTFVPIKNRLAIPASCMLAFAFTNGISGQPALLAGSQSHREAAPRSLRGEKTSYINLQSQSAKEVVVLVSDGCHACQMAKSWLALHPTFPARLVRVLPGGQKPASADEIAPPPLRVASIPRFLFIDHDRIVSEQTGWSENLPWQLTLESDVKNFLSAREGK